MDLSDRRDEHVLRLECRSVGDSMEMSGINFIAGRNGRFRRIPRVLQKRGSDVDQWMTTS